jgi:hypothetical protein
MASSHDFFVSGKQDAAVGIVAQALEGEGFSLTTTANGGLLAQRGSVARTVLLGAMAGKNFHLSFTVDFMTDSQGRLVARLNRELASGILKGGAFGAAKTDRVFQECADAIGFALERARVLAFDKAN